MFVDHLLSTRPVPVLKLQVDRNIIATIIELSTSQNHRFSPANYTIYILAHSQENGKKRSTVNSKGQDKQSFRGELRLELTLEAKQGALPARNFRHSFIFHLFTLFAEYLLSSYYVASTEATIGSKMTILPVRECRVQC